MLITYVMIPAIAYALNEALKKAGMPNKYCGIVNIIIGAIIGAVITLSFESVIIGVMSGLSAGGVYSGAKTLIAK